VIARGDIYTVSLDPTQGHEQQGRRPVLVVSATAFNGITRLPIVVPVTTGGAFARGAGFTVSLASSGLRTTGVVRCDQPRALDLSARGARRVESIPEAVMDEVLAKIVAIFE
jgi:mRNA-degrading endonuclease toxin of MazEF toxin-antitoxin module